MDEYSAYRSAELAAVYDAVYANSHDLVFWEQMTAAVADGPILELGCGTGRVLLPLARAGHEITGIDLAPDMLARCRAKLEAEPPEVRDRVTLVEADMASFDLSQRFSSVFCAFGSFHHLRTVEQQLGCLEACRTHLSPGGRLVLDLINPDPAPEPAAGDSEASESAEGESAARTVEWTDGREIRSWATVIGQDRALQCNDCEATYEITEPDGTTTRLTETFPMRFVFRYELEHLLARSGFCIASLFGDYDRSEFADHSPGMIAVAELEQD